MVHFTKVPIYDTKNAKKLFQSQNNNFCFAAFTAHFTSKHKIVH